MQPGLWAWSRINTKITAGAKFQPNLAVHFAVATLDFDAPLIFEQSAAFLATHLGRPA